MPLARQALAHLALFDRLRGWVGRAPAAGALAWLAVLCLCWPSLSQAQYDKSAWPATLATPSLDVQDLTGRRWTTADLRGRVVVLNFWASWCGPCLAELPSLQTLHQSSDDQAVVLAINVKEWERTVRAFVARTQLRLPGVLDSQGALTRQWGVRIYPTTVLIDPQGRARWRVVGEVNWTSPLATSWLRDLAFTHEYPAPKPH